MDCVKVFIKKQKPSPDELRHLQLANISLYNQYHHAGGQEVDDTPLFKKERSKLEAGAIKLPSDDAADSEIILVPRLVFVTTDEKANDVGLKGGKFFGTAVFMDHSGNEKEYRRWKDEIVSVLTHAPHPNLVRATGMIIELFFCVVQYF